MNYESITPSTREQAEKALQGEDAEKIVHALLSISHYENDWEWVQERVLSFLDSPMSDVRKTAVICLGHLARIHGKLDRSRVLGALTKFLTDPECSGQAEDALDDIEMFTREAA